MSRPKPLPEPSRLPDLIEEREVWRGRGEAVVFTNGCFDLLHAGHVDLLARARALGNRLVVGLNDDASIRRHKGRGRPLMPYAERAEVLLSLSAVDRVVGFAEDTPADLIETLVPDVLVKGADWSLDRIVGREVVEAAGGRVERIELLEGRSTSAILERIREGRGIPI